MRTNDRIAAIRTNQSLLHELLHQSHSSSSIGTKRALHRVAREAFRGSSRCFVQKSSG